MHTSQLLVSCQLLKPAVRTGKYQTHPGVSDNAEYTPPKGTNQASCHQFYAKSTKVVINSPASEPCGENHQRVHREGADDGEGWEFTTESLRATESRRATHEQYGHLGSTRVR